jgi:hypothetical protein
VRGNTGKLRLGTQIDGSAISMFHAAARSLRRFADVKNKQVMIERCATHQFDFIFANLAQRVFHIGLFPPVAVNCNGDARFDSADLKYLECANLNRTVSERIVVRRF